MRVHKIARKCKRVHDGARDGTTFTCRAGGRIGLVGPPNSPNGLSAYSHGGAMLNTLVDRREVASFFGINEFLFSGFWLSSFLDVHSVELADVELTQRRWPKSEARVSVWAAVWFCSVVSMEKQRLR